MSGLQLYYTSCRRGLGNGKGFQVRAATPGLSPDDVRDVERRSSFQPPRNLPSQPTPEDIATFRLLPAFRCYPVSSGRLAMTRSCYVGKDYTGRYGNFFAHTIVVEGDLPGWAIDYCEWEGWKSALLPEEDTSDAPPALPAVALGEIPASVSFNLGELRDFLREVDGRQTLLREMIRAVLMCRQLSRPVVIRDSQLNGLFWVARVTKALPAAHATQVSLSTYEHAPRYTVMLNATTTDTDFLCDEEQRRSLLLLFDLVTGARSEIPAGNELYASTVAEWMANAPEKLAEFHELMAELDRRALDEGLVHGLRLHQLLCGEPVPAAELGPALAFAGRHMRREARAKIIGRIAEGATLATTDVLAVRAILDLLVSAAADGAIERARAAPIWLAAFDAALVTRRSGVVEELVQWAAILHDRLGSGASADALLLAPDTLARLCDRIRSLTDTSLDQLELLLRLLLGVASRVAEPDVRKAAIAMVLSAAADCARGSSAMTLALLRAAGGSHVAEVCHQLLPPPTATPIEAERQVRHVSEDVRAHLASLPETERATVRRALDERATWPILLAEWHALLGQARDPVAFLDRYRESLAKYTPMFAAAHRGAFMCEVTDALSSPARERQALAWIMSGEVRAMDRGRQQWCVTAAAQGISLRADNRQADVAAKQVKELAQHLDISLRPDRPALRELLACARDGDATRKGLLATQRRLLKDTLAEHLAQLPAEDYMNFAEVFLPALLARATTAVEHREALDALVTDAHAREHEAAYLAALRSPLLRSHEPGLRAAILFWLVDAERAAPRTHALKSLERQLAALSREAFEQMVGMIDDSRLRSSARADWEQLREAAAHKRASAWGRIAGLFRVRKAR